MTGQPGIFKLGRSTSSVRPSRPGTDSHDDGQEGRGHWDRCRQLHGRGGRSIRTNLGTISIIDLMTGSSLCHRIDLSSRRELDPCGGAWGGKGTDNNSWTTSRGSRCDCASGRMWTVAEV